MFTHTARGKLLVDMIDIRSVDLQYTPKHGCNHTDVQICTIPFAHWKTMCRAGGQQSALTQCPQSLQQKNK